MSLGAPGPSDPLIAGEVMSSSLFPWAGLPTVLAAARRAPLVAGLLLLPAFGLPPPATQVPGPNQLVPHRTEMDGDGVDSAALAGIADDTGIADAIGSTHGVGIADTTDPADSESGCDVLWAWPVDAPITDGYRPPSHPYGPGNRGLEFGTESGDPVRAVADGTVRFAGTVGTNRFVTVEQASGLRATYGFIEQALVTSGQTIDQGQTIAIAGPGFHLTARVGTRYRDPTPLLQNTCYRVRLVPVPAATSAD